MLKTIAIDGACRRNGKADCISAGACFILDQDGLTQKGTTLSQCEERSTSQRGEIMGLQLALDHASTSSLDTDILIITDSEYLFNTMTKEWVSRWEHNGWKTAQGEDVKNKDLWQEVWRTYEKLITPITFYHIKGHLFSIGAKKAKAIMQSDSSGFSLYGAAMCGVIKDDKLRHARELSLANNGFVPDEIDLRVFAAMNLVADVVANLTVENLDAKQWQSMLSVASPTA